MTILNFSISNPSLARVKAYTSSKPWVNITLRNLPKVDADLFIHFIETLSGEDLTDEDKDNLQVIALQFNADSSFKAAYAPSVSALEDKLVIKLGSKIVELKADRLELLDVSIENYALGGRYADPTLMLSLEQAEDDFVTLPLPLRLNKEAWSMNKEDTDGFVRKLKALLKKGSLDKIAAQLMQVKLAGETTDSTLINVTELEENKEYGVVKVRKVKVSYGTNFILTLDNGADIWATREVRELLELGGEISADSTFSYYTMSGANGKTYVNSRLTNVKFASDTVDDFQLAELF